MKFLIAALLSLLSLSTFGATSEEERAKLKYEFTFQTGFNYNLSTAGLGASYFIDANRLVGFKFGSGSSSEEKTTYVALQYKHYFGNSFYVAGDAMYLNSREDVNGVWGDFFGLHDYAEYKSLGAEIRIGNQWTWEHFTLGCDWVGIGQRFGTFEKETQRLNDTTFTLLNLIIGASF